MPALRAGAEKLRIQHRTRREEETSPFIFPH